MDEPRCSLSCHEGRRMEPTPEQAERERRALVGFSLGVIAVFAAVFFILADV